jgi:hypothetical protein
VPDVPLALYRLAETVGETCGVLNEITDPADAYRAATAVGMLARKLTEAAALTRGRALIAIRDADELTVQALADRMAISKTRAAQLIAGAERRDPAVEG